LVLSKYSGALGKSLPEGQRIWVSGPVIDDGYAAPKMQEAATWSSPIQYSESFKITATIRLECAAIVDKAGVVIERLY
jgi:hypothetical protein